MNPSQIAGRNITAQIFSMPSLLLVAFVGIAFVSLTPHAYAGCTWSFQSSTQEDRGLCPSSNSCGYLNPDGQSCGSSGAICFKRYNGGGTGGGCYLREEEYLCTGSC